MPVSPDPERTIALEPLLALGGTKPSRLQRSLMDDFDADNVRAI